MSKVGIVAGLAAGFIVGYNWPTIKKVVTPLAQAVGDGLAVVVQSGLRTVIQVKEGMEDRFAEQRARKDLEQEAETQEKVSTGAD